MSSKISQLTSTTTPVTTDEFPLARSGGNRKITYANLKESLFSKFGQTVFVDNTYGNDVTGEVENPAKPFQSIFSAHAASAAFWTGATAPSSTNIITMKLKGTFSETVTMLSYHNYDISDSDVNGLWRDNGGVVFCQIYGKGSMLNLSANVIQLTAASNVFVDVYEIYGKIITTTGTLTVKADVIYNLDTIFAPTGGIITVQSPYILSLGGSTITASIAGTVTFSNCIFLSNNEVLKTNTSTNAAVIKFENCYMKTSGTNFDVINLLTNTGSNITLTLKDCTLIANGTGNSIDAAQATNVYIYGSNQTNLTHDTGNVTLLVGTVANGRFLIDAATA